MAGYKCGLCGYWVEYPSDHEWTCANYKSEEEL